MTAKSNLVNFNEPAIKELILHQLHESFILGMIFDMH